MAEVLRLSGVHAGYGPTVVLEDIDLVLPERATLALLGRNGVGKTTLLATVFGLTTLHRGSIEYRGKPIAHMTVYDHARLGMGYVPQARDIFPSLTVEENLTVAERPGKWTLARVYDLFPRIAERRGHMGNQISGGEQQMLSIGRALMGNPELLLMDEPFEGLAPTIVDTLLLAIRRLLAESALTLVLVEQSARLALELTQQAMVLNRGRISYAGSSAELLEDPQRLTSLVLAQ
jgi:branched-chain amino acid transport system ATP-binding protein